MFLNHSRDCEGSRLKDLEIGSKVPIRFFLLRHRQVVKKNNCKEKIPSVLIKGKKLNIGNYFCEKSSPGKGSSFRNNCYLSIL
jgi:hypothetical protein